MKHLVTLLLVLSLLETKIAAQTPPQEPSQVVDKDGTVIPYWDNFNSNGSPNRGKEAFLKNNPLYASAAIGMADEDPELESDELVALATLDAQKKLATEIEAAVVGFLSKEFSSTGPKSKQALAALASINTRTKAGSNAAAVEQKVKGITEITNYRSFQNGVYKWTVLLGIKNQDLARISSEHAKEVLKGALSQEQENMKKLSAEARQQVEQSIDSVISNSKKIYDRLDEKEKTKQMDALESEKARNDLNQKQAMDAVAIDSARVDVLSKETEILNKKALIEAQIKNLNKEKEVKKPEVDPSAPVKKDDQ